jgi:uncharacterized phage protein (TIGR02218 family)
MMSAPSSVVDFLNSSPRTGLIANLFTFSLLSGPVYTFTDWRRPLTVAGVTYAAGPPRLQRGTISVERGMMVSTQKVTFQEANAEFITMLAQGYFRRALYSMDRMFAPMPAPGAPIVWTQPFNRFTGRLNSIDRLTRTSAEITIKSMMDDLDNEFPRSVIQCDCDAVLYDNRCGLNVNSFKTAGVVAAGSTKNTLLSNLTQADVYYTQGYLTFTSGPMSGLSYMVKSYASQTVNPAQPFLVVPAAGTTFNIFAGCDKTLPTCISKFGYDPSAETAPFHRGKPYVPDPTVTY